MSNPIIELGLLYSSLANIPGLISRLSAAQQRVMFWVLILITQPPCFSCSQRNSSGGPVAASASPEASAAGPPAGLERRATARSFPGVQRGAGTAAATTGTVAVRLRGAAGPCPGAASAAHGGTTAGQTAPGHQLPLTPALQQLLVALRVPAPAVAPAAPVAQAAANAPVGAGDVRGRRTPL